MLLGSVGKQAKAAEDEADSEADDIALPFSPEVGTAAGFAGGFAVGALEPARGSTSAVVAIVSPALGLSRKVDLGKVHGDIAPPHVAALADQGRTSLFLAVPDSAARGTVVRLARIDDLKAGAVAHIGEVAQGSDDSEALALEAGSKTALLAWDDWDAKGGHEVVKAVSFSAARPVDKASTSPTLGATVVVSPKGVDAEGPRLARRGFGFWVAWIRSDAAAKKAATDKPAAPEKTGEDKPDETPAPRYVELVPLDATGAPAGAPLAVTPKTGHVTAFDLVAAKDDGALVAWRDAVTLPEADQTPGGVIRLALVRADGSVEPRALVEEDVGSGVPLLLPNEPMEKGIATFMAVVGDNGAVRLAALDDGGRGKDVLAPEASIGIATPLAAQGASLLAARPHGSGLELYSLACVAGPPPAN